MTTAEQTQIAQGREISARTTEVILLQTLEGRLKEKDIINRPSSPREVVYFISKEVILMDKVITLSRSADDIIARNTYFAAKCEDFQILIPVDTKPIGKNHMMHTCYDDYLKSYLKGVKQ